MAYPMRFIYYVVESLLHAGRGIDESTEDIIVTEGLNLRKFTPMNDPDTRRDIILLIPGGPHWSLRAARKHSSLLARQLSIENAGIPIVVPLDDTGCVIFEDAINKVQLCAEAIKGKWPERRIHCIGISVGGLILSLYLSSLIHTPIDFFYMICSNPDPEKFINGLHRDPWMSIYVNILRRKVYHLPGGEEWSSEERLIEKLSKFPINVNPPKPLSVIYGEDDEISKGIEEIYDGEVKLIKARGSHCERYSFSAAVDEILSK